MPDEKYNGWTNYETWCVKLWIDNEEPSYNYWRDAAQEVWGDSEADATFTRSESAAIALAKRLKEEFEEANPVADQASVWADLMGAALSEVNWDEIANAMIEEGEFSEEAEEAAE